MTSLNELDATRVIRALRQFGLTSGLRADLLRLAKHPSQQEVAEELHILAREISWTRIANRAREARCPGFKTGAAETASAISAAYLRFVTPPGLEPGISA